MSTDTLRAALEQVITMAKRGLGLDPSSMDNYLVWIQDKARAALAQPEEPAPTLTDEQIDDLAREMVNGGKSVNWLARAIERAVRGTT